MKKKILFVIPEYSHGGTNKSLENLLHFIDKEEYDISIYSLYEDGGRLYKDKFSPYIVSKSILYHFAHDNQVTRKIIGILIKLSKSINFNRIYQKEAKRLQKKYNFDTIIAFQEGLATEFVSYIDDNVRKVAWIHFDYAMIKDEINLRERMRFYDKFHHIICVSQAALNSMLEVQPEYINKSSYIYNTLSVDSMRKLAEIKDEFPLYENDVFNILSIGRFVTIKQFHIIPAIAKEIKQRTKKKFCWYIMGSGVMYSTIAHNIVANGVQDCVKIIEAKDNPYPYFKQADLHVCTSTHESFSYTIAESKILHTPVLCNDFPVAEEVVDDNVGWICNINDMANKIADIINDKDGMYSKVKETISTYKYDNGTIMSMFYQIIETPHRC